MELQSDDADRLGVQRVNPATVGGPVPLHPSQHVPLILRRSGALQRIQALRGVVGEHQAHGLANGVHRSAQGAPLTDDVQLQAMGGPDARHVPSSLNQDPEVVGADVHGGNLRSAGRGRQLAGAPAPSVPVDLPAASMTSSMVQPSHRASFSAVSALGR